MRRDTITKSALPHNARKASSSSMVVTRGRAKLWYLPSTSASASASGRANDEVTSATGMSLASASCALRLRCRTVVASDLPLGLRSDCGLQRCAAANSMHFAPPADLREPAHLDPAAVSAAATATPPIKSAASIVRTVQERRASLRRLTAATDASARARTRAADRGAVHAGIHRSSLLSAATIATATSARSGAGSFRRSIRSGPRAARSRDCSGPRHTSTRSGRARDPAARS